MGLATAKMRTLAVEEGKPTHVVLFVARLGKETTSKLKYDGSRWRTAHSSEAKVRVRLECGANV